MRWSVVAAAGLLLPVPAAAQEGGAFPDGDWQGVMVYSAALAFGEGASGTASGNGSFTLSASGGEITAGSFGFTTTAEVDFGGTGSGSATVSADGGSISGPSGAPLLVPGDLRVTGEASINGVTVPIDVTLPAAEAGGLVLTIDAVGCDRVSGDMSQEVTGQFEQAGVGVPRLVFRWSATRAGADAAVIDALGTAIDEADKLVIAAARGDLDPAALGDLLGEAEAIGAGLPATGSCPVTTFSTPLSGAVLDLLTSLTAEPGAATAGQLWAAVNAGIRTGVLGPDSPLRAAVAASLSALLEGATDGEALSVHLTARALGDDALAARALEVAGG